MCVCVCVYMFLCLYICVFDFKAVSSNAFFFPAFTSTQRKLIHNIYSELVQKGRFVGFFFNTFLFPEKTSAVTSWSAADIKPYFQSLLKKKKKPVTL